MKTRSLLFSLLYVAGLLLAFCAAYIGLAAFSMPDCDVERRESTPSPDGKHVAIVFGVDCGATTGFNTQLSLLPSDAAFDRDRFPPVLVLKDKWTLDIRWVSDVAVFVAVPKGAYEYKRVADSGGISVTYDGLASK